MQRFILMMVVIFATSVWAPTGLVVCDAGAATTPGARNVAATDPSGVDFAGDYERAAVTLDGEVLF